MTFCYEINQVFEMCGFMTRTKQNEKKRQNHQKNDYYGNVFKLPL